MFLVANKQMLSFLPTKIDSFKVSDIAKVTYGPLPHGNIWPFLISKTFGLLLILPVVRTLLLPEK